MNKYIAPGSNTRRLFYWRMDCACLAKVVTNTIRIYSNILCARVTVTGSHLYCWLFSSIGHFLVSWCCRFLTFLLWILLLGLPLLPSLEETTLRYINRKNSPNIHSCNPQSQQSQVTVMHCNTHSLTGKGETTEYKYTKLLYVGTILDLCSEVYMKWQHVVGCRCVTNEYGNAMPQYHHTLPPTADKLLCCRSHSGCAVLCAHSAHNSPPTRQWWQLQWRS